jgi:hypothetical protein
MKRHHLEPRRTKSQNHPRRKGHPRFGKCVVVSKKRNKSCGRSLRFLQCFHMMLLEGLINNQSSLILLYNTCIKGKSFTPTHPPRRSCIGFSNNHGQIHIDRLIVRVIVVAEWMQQNLGQIQQSRVKESKNTYSWYAPNTQLAVQRKRC